MGYGREAVMTQEHRLEEIKEKFGNRFTVLMDELNRELDSLKEAVAQKETFSQTDVVITQLQKLRSGYSQGEVLNSLLDVISDMIPRVLLLILKDHHLHGWSARGFEESFQGNKVKNVHWDTGQHSELSEAIENEMLMEVKYSDLGDISDSISEFDGFSPVKSAFLPVMVRGKVAGLLYMDSGSTMELPNLEAVDMLAHVASLELTMITAKLKKKRPVFKQEKPSQVVEEKSVSEKPAEDIAYQPDEAQPEELEPSEAQPSEAQPSEVQPSEAQPDEVEPEEIELEEAQPEEVQPGEVQPSEVQPDETEPDTDLPDASQIEFQTTEKEEVPLGGKLAYSGSEPDDMPPYDDSPREVKKAKRVARVLISDLILYNQEKVAEGRRTGGLYNLLKEDIDRSFEHYQSRTDGLVPNEPNFFREELVKSLAEGQQELLGSMPF